jgi:hypothetical protein
MSKTNAPLSAADIFDFSIVDGLKSEIEQVNMKYGGKPYYFREGFLTYSDFNIRHGGHGRRVVESFNRMFSEVSGGSRYLEIGCVDVPALDFLHKRFDELVLIEPNPYNREIAGLVIDALNVSNVSVVPSIIETEGTFDVIAAWECLEHVVSVDASVGAAQCTDYWQAKQDFLTVVKSYMTADSHMFWSVPVMTGWVFAAKYLAALAKGNRYSEIDFHDSILHLFGQTRRIEKWIPVSSHLGFNESQFAELMCKLFSNTDVRKLPGRKGINEHLYGHSRISA